jgi:hypothetical protein
LLRRVVVSLGNDPNVALIGVLWRARGPWIVLKQAAMKQGDGPIEPADGGELVVERANVSFVQVLS